MTYGLGCANPSAPCPLSGQDEVTLGITLVDAAGHRSERADFSFDVFGGELTGKTAPAGRSAAAALRRMETAMKRR